MLSCDNNRKFHTLENQPNSLFISENLEMKFGYFLFLFFYKFDQNQHFFPLFNSKLLHAKILSSNLQRIINEIKKRHRFEQTHY